MNEAANLTGAQPGTTHILIDYPKQGMTHLFRASDGMMIGMRMATQVKWGLTAADTQTRVFINEACALFFLKHTAAREDLVKQLNPVCVHPYADTTCGYTADRHTKLDGKPMGHDFSPAAVEPIFEERDGEPRVEIPSPLLSNRRN